MIKTIGIVSLGCPKNRVDTENMLGILGNEGYQIVTDPADADVIIVNTCGFIDDAKDESIQTVLEMAEFKKQRCKLLIMAGCLAERYHDQILTELPEVDAVLGTGDYHKIAEVVRMAEMGEKPVLAGHIDDAIPEGLPRILSTGGASAYLKIADGCDNTCTYCVIPQLRGKYRSRPFDDVVSEAEALAQSGVKELIVIAQDTTRYGYDLYGEERLSALLSRLCEIDGIHWVRVHYMYPESITDAMIDVFAENEKIVKYMDIPLQHINDRILKRMGRRTSRKEILALLEKLRKKMPYITIRTSLIAGFPSETEEEFDELLAFIKEARLARLGVFAYSKEENTAAARLAGQLPEDVKKDRADTAMAVQSQILTQLQEEKLGTTVEVLAEGYDEESLLYFGRSAADSIDVDTKVYFAAQDEVEMGSFVQVKILNTDGIDCIGEQVYKD
ncbi:MAG: 30S ribosomal protein S12 methylthiotransferase RimO [Clostridia bacterium]|nr:30S ribosomal protein S12 methylthiotransferase RimO [Clostridia bacterium]